MNLADLPLQAVTLPSGVVLHHARAGQGRPLVFIHGAMGDWRSFEPQWPHFVRDFDCVTYSRRYSYPNPNTMPSPDHGAIQEADDLLGLLDALGWRSATLVGSSYGGFTALMLAQRQPARVDAVVAVEPPMMRYALLSEEGARVAAAFRAETIEPANAAFRRGDDIGAAAIMTGGISGTPVGEMQGEAMQRRLQNTRAMKMLALSSDEFPWIEPAALAALPMPVLLLSGQDTAPVHDVIFRNVAAAMPGALAEKVPGATHSVSRDQPEVFNRRVRAFLRDALAQRPQAVAPAAAT